MPFLRIQTNTEPDVAAIRGLLTQASQLVSRELGKPERYVMVAVDAGSPMLFAGEDSPLAYLELKSIGLPKSATESLSRALCGLMREHIGISPDRVYIEFTDAPRQMWGWNEGTF